MKEKRTKQQYISQDIAMTYITIDNSILKENICILFCFPFLKAVRKSDKSARHLFLEMMYRDALMF